MTLASSLGKGLVGAGVGFSLYLLIGGLGRRQGEREGASSRRPRDPARLVFVMTGPGAIGAPMTFRLRGDPGTNYSLEGLIARVKEGGRLDVALDVSGAVTQRSWDAARDLIRGAGLAVQRVEYVPIGSRVIENDRGRYGRRILHGRRTPR